MSIYSGRCDLADSLIMIREVNDETTDWSKIKIYQHTPETYFDEKGIHGDILLDIKCTKDLLPYGPFIVGMAYGDKDGTYICHIGQRSYVDEEEEERFTWILDEVKKIYRRCKRKKIPFKLEDVAKELSWWWNGNNTRNAIETLFNRVKEHPYSANAKGLHDNLHQYYRERLYEDMVEAGYTEDQAREWAYNNNKTW